jgi:diguanylate cyclase (GGDEF)-like protein
MSTRGEGGRSRDPITAEVAPVEAVAQPASACRAALVFATGGQMGRMVPMEAASVVVGRDDVCDLVVADEGVSRRHLRLSRTPAAGWEVEDLHSTNGTSVNGVQVQRRLLADGDRLLLGRTVLKFLLQAPVEEEYHRRLYQASTRDPLTGACNRRFFDERLAAEIAFAVRHRTPLSLLMIDLDHFKRINDTHGHPAGDRVLVAVADALLRQVRAEDLAARWGGEEFAVLVRDLAEPGGVELAERIRRTIEGLSIPHGDGRIAVTVSIGVGGGAGDSSLTRDGLVAAADRFLYGAKRAGRNRVVSASS